MTTEYTRGPWVAKQSATDARQWSVGLLGKYHVHGCGDVNADGETPYMLMSGICSHKDAHILAAAPELLDALEELAERASGFSVSGVYFDEPCMTVEVAALQKAYAAIAKARGAS